MNLLDSTKNPEIGKEKRLEITKLVCNRGAQISSCVCAQYPGAHRAAWSHAATPPPRRAALLKREMLRTYVKRNLTIMLPPSPPPRRLTAAPDSLPKCLPASLPKCLPASLPACLPACLHMPTYRMRATDKK